jgi:hypothetical protein
MITKLGRAGSPGVKRQAKLMALKKRGRRAWLVRPVHRPAGIGKGEAGRNVLGGTYLWHCRGMTGGNGPRLRGWHQQLRTGIVVLVLLCGPVVAVLAGARRPWHPLPQVLVTAIGIGIGFATLYVGWAVYLESRAGRAGSGQLGLEEAADWLAGAVGRQWHGEAAVRRLNDPYPLPVR